MKHALDRRQPPGLHYLEPESPAAGMHLTELELLRSSAPFKASRFTVEPGCSSPVDSHGVREIWLVARGAGEVVYDGRAVRAKADDVFYFEPFKTHQLRNDGDEKMVVFSVWWEGQ
jgi:mannose-6-phosphate isomerase-like protein (cupin superfamily)